MTVMSIDELRNMPALSQKELSIVNNAKPVFSDDCPELSPEELKEFRPWYNRKKQSVTIDIDVDIVNYYKRLAVESGISYENMMEMYLSQCAKSGKKPYFA